MSMDEVCKAGSILCEVWLPRSRHPRPPAPNDRLSANVGVDQRNVPHRKPKLWTMKPATRQETMFGLCSALKNRQDTFG